MNPDKMVRELVTPEGVDLRLMLADGGERVSAFLLDVIFILGVLIALTVALVGMAFLFGFGSMQYLGIIWILGFFLLRNFWFIGFELTARAATPGKRIVGLRVATRDGSPLTANAIFARNAMRELEIFLPLSFLLANVRGIDAWISIVGLVWCGIFLFFPLFNRDRLRVGDLVGGTWVVLAPKRILDTELSAGDSRLVFSEAALDAYGIKELNILENVLRRRDPATMEAVATRIRKKIGYQLNVPDGEFLSAYYIALRGRLETRLLFGRRRRDKYEPV
ncbi:MAG TPA: RDD family protein [Rhizomicrobium sp.]|nr:RDD family protein [Rhizomicrobium sp.]